MRCSILIVCALSAAAFGCGSSGSGSDGPKVHQLATRGTMGDGARATFEDDVVIADLTVNGKPGHVLIDTGSPVNLLSPTMFGVPKGASRIGTIDVGKLTLLDVPVLGYAPNGGLGDGIVGGGTLCQFVTTIDYRDGSLTLGAGAPAINVGPTTTIDFSLEGGGTGLLPTGDVVTFPATRIAITAKIEGVDHAFVVDSGASFNVVRASLFASLVKDGRKARPIAVSLIAGTATAEAFRLKRIEVGGASVDAATAAYPGSDELLDQLGVEVHHTVDGLVGGTFLREFNVVVDFPGKQLRLSRYTTRDHIHDAFQRVGFTLQKQASSYSVGQVLDGTDAAAQSVSVGDRVISVDDHALDGLSATEADMLLRGAVGTTHVVKLDRAGAPQTLTLRVDELLPLP